MSKILGSTLLGTVAFIISGVMACMAIVLTDNYILATVIAGGIGGLLLGLFLRLRRKVGRSAIAGAIGMTVGYMAGFFLAESIGSLFSNLPDIIAIVLVAMIFGAIFGAVVYGRKSIWLFAITCGIASVPFGILVVAMNSGHWIKSWLGDLLKVFGQVDTNFLVITVSLGLGAGVSIGMYKKRR